MTLQHNCFEKLRKYIFATYNLYTYLGILRYYIYHFNVIHYSYRDIRKHDDL